MNLLRNIPIASRFRRAVILTSTIVLLLTCLSFIAYEYYTFRNSTVSYLSTLGEIIAANSTAAMAFESREDAEEVLSALKAEDNIVAARLFDRKGNVFSQYPADLPMDTISCKSVEWGYRFVDGYLEGFQRVKHEDRYLGALYIRSDLSAMSDRFMMYGLIVIMILIAAALTISFLGRLLQNAVARPVLHLSATAQSIAEKRDYTLRARKPDDHELGALTDAFNHMLEQIEQRDALLSDFNRKLEAKVAERTLELQAAIRELKEAEKEVQQKNTALERAFKEVQKAEQQLLELNTDLEKRVSDRTNELRISEEQLRLKNEELERTVVDLDNFVYRASHDLKSPISNIEGLTIMFKRQLQGRLSPDELKLLEMIEVSLAKFKSTIQDLTEVSKVQKYQDLPDEVVKFSDVLAEVKDDIWQMISESEVEIKDDFQVSEITFASANLRSIIYNLVSNAIKYRSPDRRAVVELATFTENGKTVLTVKDNGMGMDADGLDKIFNMFKRLHAHVDGSGIGLYITKRIIDNRGGSIMVSSEVGKGSEFKVIFG